MPLLELFFLYTIGGYAMVKTQCILSKTKHPADELIAIAIDLDLVRSYLK
jgi:hypothetical protein